mmetsp:Transcript_43905/g.121593  ORF Transcript_43905/g.121593 Transcript_43905/m.121593 type:complete len:151 (-) Transcript_43905:1029-1481(-)
MNACSTLIFHPTPIYPKTWHHITPCMGTDAQCTNEFRRILETERNGLTKHTCLVWVVPLNAFGNTMKSYCHHVEPPLDNLAAIPDAHSTVLLNECSQADLLDIAGCHTWFQLGIYPVLQPESPKNQQASGSHPHQQQPMNGTHLAHAAET